MKAESRDVAVSLVADRETLPVDTGEDTTALLKWRINKKERYDDSPVRRKFQNVCWKERQGRENTNSHQRLCDEKVDILWSWEGLEDV